MGGLLERAHSIRNGASANAPASNADITPEEGVALMAQIEAAVARPHGGTAHGLEYTARRSGTVFPVVLNAAAAALIALAAVAVPLYFDRQIAPVTSAGSAALVGEGRLVSTVRQEAEAGIRSRDQEIVQIQGTLEQANKELTTLRTNADAQVAAKQQQLQAAFDAQLAAEKQRLLDAGTSTASVEKQLAALRAQQKADQDAQVADFRKSVDAALAAQEAALTAKVDDTKRSLAAAEADKAQLQAQLDAQAKAAAAAQGAQDQLARQLDAATARAQKEQLVLDQVTASYAAVQQAMKARNWASARESLAGLAAYLSQDSVASLPAIQRRRSVDLFLVDALGSQVAASASAEAAPAANPAADALAALVDALVGGDALYKAGDYAGALQKYREGLAGLGDELPGSAEIAARVADAGFRTGQAAESARQERSAKPAVDAADVLARRGSYAEAIAAYAAALRSWPLAASAPRAVQGVQASLASLIAAQQKDAAARASAAAAFTDSVAAVKAGLSAAQRAGAASGPTASAAQAELIALLDAKVKIKGVLASEDVKKKYPGLGESLERYIQVYGEEASSQGRLNALADVTSVLDYLLGSAGKDALTPVYGRNTSQEAAAAFQKVLDRLRQLPQ